jgi:hypothetical protein
VNGLITSDDVEPNALGVSCRKLMMALRDVKVRLRAQYERRFPGESGPIRKAIKEAEIAAWRTPFPHLFLPDLAEEAIARRAGFAASELRDETASFANVA